MNLRRAFILSLCTATIAAAQTNALNSSGNVGIGTTSPEYSLDVRGPGSFVSSGSGSLGLRIITPHSANDGNITFNNESGSTFAWLLSYRRYSDNGDFWIFNGNRWATDFVIKNATGDIGIGTATPRSKLHVLGPITAGSVGGSTSGVDYLYGLYGSGSLFVLGSQYSSAASFLGFAVKAKPGATGYLSSTEISCGRSAIEADGGHISFLTGVNQTSTDGGPVDISERMRIGANGNLGIGTSNPTRQLSVYHQYAEAVLKSSAGSGGTGGSTLYFGNSSADDVGWLNYNHTNNSLTIRVNSANRMRIDADGNVGIGETNPTHKLAVNGTIKAKEVIVETTGWSDYVFAEDYRLAPLSEVEAHIKTNKHLPGIPSAAQVAEQGVSLGDMQARLLAKIEELTLHQIAQEKELAALRSKVAVLEQGR